MNIPGANVPDPASPRALARATLAAGSAAAVVLLVFVLPAEWGVDPTGLGKVMGLTRMAEASAGDEAQPEGPAPGAAAGLVIAPQVKENIATTTPWRTDSKTVTLAAHSGMEVKAHMARGDRLVFRWTSKGGTVRMDMHGEPVNARDGEFTTYWKQKDLAEAQGSFIAAYDGTHGWYWRNGGEEPVTIKLETAGFYKDLFEPPAE